MCYMPYAICCIMKIILLKDIAKVGKRHEIKDVPDGYARNFLIPQKSALFATPQEIQRILETKKAGEKGEEMRNASFESALKNLKGKKISLKAPASEKGSLYANVGKEEIAKAIEKETGVPILPEYILLSSPLKSVGEHAIKVGDDNKKTQLMLVIEGEESGSRGK